MKEFTIIFFAILILNMWWSINRIELKIDHVIKNQVHDYEEYKNVGIKCKEAPDEQG